MKDMDMYTWIAYIIVLVGGINWGLVGLFNVDIVSAIFGGLLARLIFIIVGVAAGYLIYLLYMEKMNKDGGNNANQGNNPNQNQNPNNNQDNQGGSNL